MCANPWDPEWDVSSALVRRLLDRQFPELSAETVERLGHGWDNIVYRIGSDYVFRFPRRRAAVPLLQAEARILPKLSDYITVPYSKPLYFGKESTDYPAPFLGYTHVPGVLPTGLSDAQRARSAQILAQFLKSLHAFPLDTAEAEGVPHDQRNLSDIAGRKERMLGFLPKLSPHLGSETAGELESYIHTITLGRASTQKALIHGDLHYKNMLVDDTGIISGIIDWGDVNVGHPACDLSVAYSFLPPSSRPAFFETYGEVDDETHVLARMLAVFMPMLILLQSIDDRDERNKLEATRTILRALA
ncbi:phosphotransferase [Paenibacillus sp. FSL R5-0810]|uniref:phosphotransferase n=1 Tax=Paenibacillus sp. FSL R5-0810 TaxID=2921659 RepID=UPI0030FA4B6C